MRKLIPLILVSLFLFPIFLSGSNVEAENDNPVTISSEQYKKAYRYNTHGWIYLHIEGDPYERGFQHGYLLADEIIDMIQRWYHIFPQKWSWRFQKLDVVRLFWNKYPEEYKQEIRGIADGVADKCGVIDGKPVDYKDILTLNEMYEYQTKFRTFATYPQKLRYNWLYIALLQKKN